ncbi:MAG: trimeric intracellular cation channel family protein [Propioniciclava sp.]
MEDGATVAGLLQVIDLAGVVTNAVLGGVVARSARLDLMGFSIVAIVSGLGGGMLRDTLLQAGTPAALTSTRFLAAALVGALVSYLIPIGGRRWNYPLLVVDALAVGTWAVAGTAKALGAGLDALPAVMLGLVTAVGGGALRDVMLQQRPAILGGNTLYATAALAASVVMVLAAAAGFPGIGMVTGTVAGAGLTLISRWRRWSLPLAPTGPQVC